MKALPMLRPSLAVVALLLGSGASHAENNCDSIRAQIETKIRVSGVKDFVLSVVEAGTGASGKVVGSCDLGTKKIIYSQSPSAAASQPRPKPTEERILTECRDGSVTVGGDCKK